MIMGFAVGCPGIVMAVGLTVALFRLDFVRANSVRMYSCRGFCFHIGLAAIRRGYAFILLWQIVMWRKKACNYADVSSCSHACTQNRTQKSKALLSSLSLGLNKMTFRSSIMLVTCDPISQTSRRLCLYS